MMGSIFWHAREVLVWLSEEDESSALVMDLALAHQELPKLDKPLARDRIASTQCRCRKAMIDLFERSYWKRIWVTQEIELAEADVWIYCGIDVVWYRGLYTTVNSMVFEGSWMIHYDPSFKHCRCKIVPCKHKLLESVVTGVAQIGKPTPKGLNHKESKTLIELMDKYVDTSCEDLRDKIFAFFAMQKDIPNTSHWLDYSLDIHFLFSLLLTLYSNTKHLFPRSETQWMLDRQFEALIGLAECGRMLLRSLQLIVESLHQYVDLLPTVPHSNTGQEIFDTPSGS